MKFIRNGKMYNTDTVQELGYATNNYAPNDFYFVEETLYKKRNGEYFLYAYGGPLSKYSKRYGNSTGGGTKIIPLNIAEAMKWAEDKLDAEKYEAIFGEVLEDSTNQLVSFSITSDNYNKLLQMKAEKGISLGALLNQLVDKC